VTALPALFSPASAAGVRGRMLALALALLVALLLWIGIAAPLLGWFAERQETLRRQQAVGRRMAALVQTLPALQAAADAAGARGAGRREALLEGASDPVAAATLQQLLDEMARTAGLRVGSVEVMPPEPAGPYRAIAVRLNVTAPWPALVALLQAIAAADVPMLVDNLQIRSMVRNSSDSEWPIDVTFSVTGYRSARAPGGGETATP
jgi:general secretion pathway protein M